MAGAARMAGAAGVPYPVEAGRPCRAAAEAAGRCRYPAAGAAHPRPAVEVEAEVEAGAVHPHRGAAGAAV